MRARDPRAVYAAALLEILTPPTPNLRTRARDQRARSCSAPFQRFYPLLPNMKGQGSMLAAYGSRRDIRSQDAPDLNADSI